VYAQTGSIPSDAIMEQEPSFNGGNGKLVAFINYYMIYPQTAFYDSVGGTVVVGFTVDKKGTMKDIMICKSVSQSLDSEAIRVIRLMSQVLPKWKPGKHEGENASMKDSLEVTFDVNAYELTHHMRHSDKLPTPSFDISKFLADNLIYPHNAKQNNIQGTVLVKFVVNEDGSLSDFKVVKSVDPELDIEALRVIKKMPKWNPAMQNQKPLKVYFTIPVHFLLR